MHCGEEMSLDHAFDGIEGRLPDGGQTGWRDVKENVDVSRCLSIDLRNRNLWGNPRVHINHDNLTLETESDVEQKVVMPLLLGHAYLDIPEKQIFSKQYLAPTVLDKAAGRESGYYPDYTAWMQGFPVLVVEAILRVPCSRGKARRGRAKKRSPGFRGLRVGYQLHNHHLDIIHHLV